VPGTYIDPIPLKKRDRYRSFFLFNCYSYFENFFYTLINFLPHPVRILFLKIVLKKLGHNAFIDHGCYFRYPHQISIGDNVSINRKCSIFGSRFNKNTRIIIGNNVVIAPEVKIFAASHDYHDLDLPDYGEGISISDYVWIGGGAIILPGVNLGKGAVIGAGSVITRDIPDWSVAAGNPARVIKKRILNSDE
jgi:acetyltransferase-like isoleucine patch superfamily enzyme